jgi:copper chaperone for superoxide dismutase
MLEPTVHKSGDISRGTDGVGGVYEGDAPAGSRKIGELCTASADKEGIMRCKGAASLLKVWEVIGRSCVVHEGSAVDGRRLAAAVLARSAGVGGNHKMVCQCDGTKLWDAGDVA